MSRNTPYRRLGVAMMLIGAAMAAYGLGLIIAGVFLK